MRVIRELVNNSKVQVVYVPPEDKDADMLPKPLGPVLLNGRLKRLGIGGEIVEEC